METLTVFQAVILGLVQGLAEFLPISSSGHLALLQYFFGIEGESVLFFAVMLHLGTLVSVFIVYRKDIWELILELGRTIKDICTGNGPNINANPTRRLGFMIIVATIPTGIIGILGGDMFSAWYNSVVVIGTALMITGCILFVAEKMGKNHNTVKTMKFRQAVFIGVMQGVAITPGISRSGATLFGSLVMGLDRAFAVKFVFLISIPSILGSVIMELPPAIKEGIDASMAMPIIIGMAVAALSGYFAIKVMIKIVSSKKLTYFSYYTWIVGAFVVVWALFIGS